MSGYNDDAVVRHGIVDSPAAFLQQPSDSRTLATKLRDVLGHTATAAANARTAVG